MSDNRIFNVNGEGEAMLLATLKLVFAQSHETCMAWFVSETHGLVLLWSDTCERATLFPAGLSAEECLPFVLAWLKSADAKKIKKERWDADTDHDGSDGDGWRVYCEDWGHVDNEFAAICGIKPVVLWYGK